MKRLIICCDGTWKRADEINVSNIEKIARAINPEPTGGPVQIAYYSSGVGTGATRADRILGGALGVGLDTALVGAYRFLALNYNPGDEVFVFGFSRGAYTARSLVGMIVRVGLLTPRGVARNRLVEAIDIYRNLESPGSNVDEAPKDAAAENEPFRALCHSENDVRIKFLGVFDTVGTMGIPGISRKKYRFHDVELSPCVECARQALALDERRRPFVPSVWSKGPDETYETYDEDKVKQVWFRGVHSDIGGGYEACTLSDITLTWMIREAQACGLEFYDWAIGEKSQTDSSAKPHDSMTAWYRIAGAVEVIGRRVAHRSGPSPRLRKGFRVLEVPSTDESKSLEGDWGIRIAAPAYESWKKASDAGLRDLPNVGWWIEGLRRRGTDPETRIELM